MDNNTNEKEYQNTSVRVIILALLLAIPLGLIIYGCDQYFENRRSSMHEEIWKNANELLTEYIDLEKEAATRQFDEYLLKEVRLTTTILGEYVTEEGYTGPWKLDHGFVLELSGDKILTSELSPAAEAKISREQIEESLHSETMRSVMIETDYTGDDYRQMTGNCYLSFGRITDTLIYAEVTPETVFNEFLGFYTQDRQEAVEASNARFDKSIEVKVIYNNYVSHAMIIFLVLLILITMIVYILAEQRSIREKIAAGEETDRHNPSKVRKRIINATAAGALAILIISFLTQAVGQMYRQTLYGKDVLQIMSDKYSDNKEQLRKDKIEDFQEEWFIRYGSEIAAFIEDKPQIAAQEELIKYSEILGTDFIILFDSKGNQLVCSDQYEGLSVERGLGEDSSDFRRLYYGVPNIVHDVSMDTTTGLERKMIGFSMAALDDPTRYGALILALMPDQIQVLSDFSEEVEQRALLQTYHTICIIADQSTGEILYSGEPSMVGKDVRECGLTDSSLRDDYMDYGMVNGERCFIITKKSDNNILYYATQYVYLRTEYMTMSTIAVVLYLVVAALFMYMLLREYSDEKFKEWSSRLVSLESRKDSIANRFFKWDQKTPEEKASAIFYTGLFIMMQMWLQLIVGQQIANDRYESMLDYLLLGDWMRGFNLFALCSILIILAIANLIITASGWGFKLISGFMTAKGETICTLFKSMIKYVAIFVVIVVSLSYLGLMNPTVVASLGIGSVAISLGAKDVVADILAGIFIVFEETLRVGDVIEYNGNLCTVKEVGMRSTKLMIPPGNYMVVSNHELSNVKNLSKEDSIAMCSVVVVAQKSLLELEELFKRELPEVSSKSNLLKSPARLYGITQLGTGQVYNNPVPTMTLCIGAACEEKYSILVKMFLLREIRLIAEKEGIIIV